MLNNIINTPTLLKLSMAPGFRICTSMEMSMEIHSSGSKAPAFWAGRLVTAGAW